MTHRQVFLDSAGERLFVDDIVRVKCIPEELLRDLPNEDQEAISHCLEQCLTISGFDPYGNAEIDFIDQQGDPHTIWVRTNCLEKRNKSKTGSGSTTP